MYSWGSISVHFFLIFLLIKFTLPESVVQKLALFVKSHAASGSPPPTPAGGPLIVRRSSSSSFASPVVRLESQRRGFPAGFTRRYRSPAATRRSTRTSHSQSLTNARGAPTSDFFSSPHVIPLNRSHRRRTPVSARHRGAVLKPRLTVWIVEFCACFSPTMWRRG